MVVKATTAAVVGARCLLWDRSFGPFAGTDCFMPCRWNETRDGSGYGAGRPGTGALTGGRDGQSLGHLRENARFPTPEEWGGGGGGFEEDDREVVLGAFNAVLRCSTP